MAEQEKFKSLTPFAKGETIPGHVFSSHLMLQSNMRVILKITGIINQAPTKEFKIVGAQCIVPIL